MNNIVSAGITVTSTSASCATPSVNTLNVCTTWPGTAPTGATCNTANGNDSPGCYVQVKVLYTYGFSLPLVYKQVNSVTMASTSEIVIQQ